MGAARTRVYVDGLNLFYGLLKGHPERKWLDLAGLVRALRPDDEIDLIRYFTAPVSGKIDPGCTRRQDLYLRAIRAYSLVNPPKIEITTGRFRTHPKDMRLVQPLADGTTVVSVIKTEEKGSDVNLATYLLMDGVDGFYDLALVITNDSDLVEPIRVANQRYAPVHVMRPTRDHLNQLAAAATRYEPIPDAAVISSQLPDEIRLTNGKIAIRPFEWAGPPRVP